MSTAPARPRSARGTSTTHVRHHEGNAPEYGRPRTGAGSRLPEHEGEFSKRRPGPRVSRELGGPAAAAIGDLMTDALDEAHAGWPKNEAGRFDEIDRYGIHVQGSTKKSRRVVLHPGASSPPTWAQLMMRKHAKTTSEKPYSRTSP